MYLFANIIFPLIVLFCLYFFQRIIVVMHQCAISYNIYPKEIENWIPENIRQNISTKKNKY